MYKKYEKALIVLRSVDVVRYESVIFGREMAYLVLNLLNCS